MLRNLAVLLILAAAFASSAAAQTTTTQNCRLVSVITGDTEERVDDLDRAINRAECLADANLNIEITGNAGYQYDVYIGSKCATDLASEEGCKMLESAFTVGSDGTKDRLFSIQELLEQDEFDCDVGTAEMSIFFVPTDINVVSGTSSTSGTGTIACKKKIDTKPPPAPTNIKGGAGEREITVSWDFDYEDEEDLQEFLVYYEVCPGKSGLCKAAPSDCSTSADFPTTTSTDADTEEKDVDGGSENEATATTTIPNTVILSGLNYKSASNATQITLANKVEVGQKAAVVVVAVDNAENRGKPSAVTCIMGVETVGFCESLKNESGEGCKSGCSINAVSANPSSAWPWILALLAMTALVALRRKNV
jgi:MYXO-CTERM domain-containing protein